MSDLERLVHDYVDGRLAPEARREFERRLADDAELARRCADYAELGAALREELDEEGAALSPGFHTRARAAFESRRGGRAIEARRFPWEALGLAAAAVIAAVVFLPPLLRHDDTLFAPAAERPGDTASARGDRPAVGPGTEGADDADLADPVAGEKLDETQPKSILKESLPQVDPVPQPQAAPAQPELKTQPEPRLQPELKVEPEAQRKKARKQPAPAEAPAVEASIPSSAADARAEIYQDRAAEGETPPARVRENEALRRSSLSSPAKSVVQPDRAELPVGAVAAGEVVIVDSDAEWSRRLAGPGGAVLQSLRAGHGDVRAVMVGPRDGGLSCEVTLVERSATVWTVTPARGGSAGGCAIVIPADGKPIVVEPR